MAKTKEGKKRNLTPTSGDSVTQKKEIKITQKTISSRENIQAK